MKIKEFKKQYEEGKFDTNDVKILVEAGWYVRFCSDSALRRKTLFFGKAISKIEGYDDKEVMFKSSCPVNHPSYDDFRIYDEKGVIYIIVHHSPYEDYAMWSLYDIKDDQKLYQFKNTRRLAEWLNTQSNNEKMI